MTCEEDAYGVDCKQPCVAKTTCSNNGRCRGLTGGCICDEGFVGDNCSITVAECAAGEGLMPPWHICVGVIGAFVMILEV